MGGHVNIAISGATGFVGQALAVHGIQRGWNVVALTRNAPSDPLGGVMYYATGSIEDQPKLQSVLCGVEVLVHTAARVHVMKDTANDPLTAFREVNTVGTLHLARQAALAGVKRFVFISSVKVSGEFTKQGRPFLETDVPNPSDPYGVSKAEAEEGLRELSREVGLEVVIVRPPLIYGPGVKANFASLARAVRRGLPLPLGAIHNQRSLVALDNLVDFIATCATHPGAANETFFVSDGQDLSTTELVLAMSAACQVPARLIPLPAGLLTWLGRLSGKSSTVERLCGNLQVDIHKAHALLGWVPPVSVAEGMRRACKDL